MTVTASVSKDCFRLHFEHGTSAAYPLNSLRQRLRFYRRMSRLHWNPSYAAIAMALEELSDSLSGQNDSGN